MVGSLPHGRTSWLINGGGDPEWDDPPSGILTEVLGPPKPRKEAGSFMFQASFFLRSKLLVFGRMYIYIYIYVIYESKWPKSPLLKKKTIN